MSVWIPKVDVEDVAAEFRPMRRDEGMAERVKADDTSEMIELMNKPPRWNEHGEFYFYFILSYDRILI